MKVMTITTDELTSYHWDTYVANINAVFGADLTIDHYKKKYTYTIKKFSYHSLLVSEEGEVVGGCTVIPYEYWVDSKKHLIGLCVDVFIHEAYRKVPFIFFRLYSKLKKLVFNDGIIYVLGVPNEFACLFLKKILKWNTIGELPCYVLPVKLGNIINKYKWLNSLSKGGVYSWIYTIGTFGVLLRTKEEKALIRLNRENEIIEKQRYSENHKIIKLKKGQLAYQFKREKGINIVYLIDFYDNSKRRSATILFQAIQYILKNENTDLIVFVGTLRFIQFSLFKVPSRLLPKQLLLIGDGLKSSKIESEVTNIKNWDFGFFNCDVR